MVAGSVPSEDEVVTLSEEFFAQFFVGDTVNLAALSKAVNVSHEFLAGYVFEHGLGQPVTEIQAAAAAIAFESDQLATQAVAAREEEVSVLEKFGPLMQEKIQFFVKGDGATRVCRGHPSESLSLSSVLVLYPGLYVCHGVKFHDVGLSQWQCATCGALRCWPTRNQCYKCRQPRSAGSSSPLSSAYLDTHGAVGCMPQGVPSSSFFGGGAFDGPSSSQVLGSPPLNPGRFMALWVVIHLLCLRSLSWCWHWLCEVCCSGFPPGSPGGCATPLPVGPVC